MKALTILQPYAHLILLPESDPRHKRVENRTWPAPQEMIGQRIAIHAGKSRKRLDEYWNYRPAVDDRDEAARLAATEIAEMRFGWIIGTAVIAACVRPMAVRAGRYDKEFPWLNDHEHVDGPWCWVLQDVHRLPGPIMSSGLLKLWELSPSIVNVIERETGHAV